MSDVRCTACGAFLFQRVNGHIVIKGKSEIEVKPLGKVKVTCKCGKVNMINTVDTRSFHERLQLNKK